MSVQERQVPLQAIDLLPAIYVEKRRAGKAIFFWCSVVGLLSAFLFSVCFTSWIKIQQRRLERQQVLAAAAPIAELKARVLSLQKSNELEQGLADLTDTAEPQDCVLQVLGSVALAAKKFDGIIQLQSVEVQLPVELSDAENGQGIALPGVVRVAAFVPALHSGQALANQLESADQLSSVKLLTDPKQLERGLILITAEPVVSKVSP